MNQPIAFLTPFTNLENAYIAVQRELLSELGFEVRPLSLKAVLTGGCLGLADPQNVVLVHWLENRLFTLGKVERGVSAKGALQFLVYAVLLKVARARVLYFVHDHAVHDVKPGLRALSRRAIALLRRIADQRAVHDPTFAPAYDAHYLPHPLYWDQPLEHSSASAGTPLPRHAERRALRFAVMGALRPYKEIDTLLLHWPKDASLLIAGRGDPGYVAQLQGIIADRGLQDQVELQARFLSDDEFSQLLRAQDVLLLPHRVDANLVSGAFFAGVGQVRAILARDTPFISWAKGRIPGIYSFDSEEELPLRVAQIAADWPQLVGRDVRMAALSEFGWRACLSAYGEVLGTNLGPLSGAPPAPPRSSDTPPAPPQPQQGGGALNRGAC